VLNFLPLSILYQYKRLANVYFLLIICIALIPGVAPWAPITQIVPTLFVLGIAVLREGVEDYMRYNQDLKTNSQVIEQVIAEGKFKDITSREIKVGDLIKIKDGQEIPADIVLIQSSDTGLKVK
jgi:magnesium-transporting ATPase (P-type)